MQAAGERAGYRARAVCPGKMMWMASRCETWQADQSSASAEDILQRPSNQN